MLQAYFVIALAFLAFDLLVMGPMPTDHYQTPLFRRHGNTIGSFGVALLWPLFLALLLAVAMRDRMR